MRDPERIDTVLAALREVWRQSPDLRLGQLVVIATGPSEPCPEVFHVEDDRLLRGLDALRVRIEAARADRGAASAAGPAPADAEAEDRRTLDAAPPSTPCDRLDAWADGGSVQVIGVTASGDPVDLSVDEAREFSARLDRAIANAD